MDNYTSFIRTGAALLVTSILLTGCFSRPNAAQKGFGLELTSTGIGITGGANSITQFHGFGCEKAIASLGTKHKLPNEIKRGITSCDLYRIKGQPSETSELSLFQEDGEIPEWYEMIYYEGDARVRYIFHANLLDKIESKATSN